MRSPDFRVHKQHFESKVSFLLRCPYFSVLIRGVQVKCWSVSVTQQKVGRRDEEYQERARELEERLKESSQQRETLAQEVDGLNHSLQQETQLRNSAEGKIAEVHVYTCIALASVPCTHLGRCQK